MKNGDYMYKLIVSDFDKTLIDDEEKIPISTVFLFDKLRRKGLKIAIATGRCLKSVADYDTDYIFMDYIICANGAYIYDVVKDKVIYKKNILITNLKKIINLYYKESIIYLIDNKTWNLISKESAYDDFFDVIKRDNYLEFIDSNKNNIYKIEMYFKTLKLAKDAVKNINNLGLKVNANLQVDTTRYIVEVTHIDINKSIGVEKIAKKLKLTEKENIAFGDGYNDIELLKIVGCGVAVDNACTELKKVATNTTLDNNHKGVEKYLEKLI